MFAVRISSNFSRVAKRLQFRMKRSLNLSLTHTKKNKRRRVSMKSQNWMKNPLRKTKTMRRKK